MQLATKQRCCQQSVTGNGSVELSTPVTASHNEDDELIAAMMASSHALRSLTVITLHQVAPGVTLAQYETMEAIAIGQRRVTDLAAALNVTLPTASQTCNLLAAKRLVNRRRAAKDRRNVGLSLTAAGHKVLDDVDGLRRTKTRTILIDCLSTEDRAVVIAVLRAISLACERSHELSEDDRGAIG